MPSTPCDVRLPTPCSLTCRLHCVVCAARHPAPRPQETSAKEIDFTPNPATLTEAGKNEYFDSRFGSAVCESPPINPPTHCLHARISLYKRRVCVGLASALKTYGSCDVVPGCSGQRADTTDQRLFPPPRWPMQRLLWQSSSTTRLTAHAKTKSARGTLRSTL